MAYASSVEGLDLATIAARIIPLEIRNGGQSIQIPDEFALTGDHVQIFQDGSGRLVVESLTDPNPSLIELLNSREPLPDEDGLPIIDDPPPEPVDI